MLVNNDHNVYILGAGFSAPRGLPVISDFMIAMRDAHPWLVEKKRRQEAEAIEQVLQYRLRSTPAAYRISIDLENIEELFSLADTDERKLSRQIRLAIAATIDYRRSIIDEPTTSFQCKDEKLLPESWRSLGKVQGEHKCYSVPMYSFFVQSMLGSWLDARNHNAILTFNYDCLVDDALDRLGYRVDYNLRSSSGAKPVGANDVKLLKLHGSINWARDSASKSPVTVKPDYKRVVRDELIPELVPPTWRKLLAKDIIPVWNSALVEIEQATRIVIIGFSMPDTDLHFKYLLASGLTKNLSLREIVFIDRAAEIIKPRISKLFGDITKRPPIRVIDGTVSGFMNVGSVPECLHSIGRAVPSGIERVQHSAY